MRIGIDAKWYFDGPVSGVMVLQNIIMSIITSSEDEIILFVKKKYLSEAKELFADRVEVVPVPRIFNNALTNLLVLPFFIVIKKLDVMLFQYFAPGFFRKKSAVFIYDMLWRDYPQYFTLKERLYFECVLPGLKNSELVITISRTECDRVKRHVAKRRGQLAFTHLGADHFPNTKAIKPKEILNTDTNKYLLCVGRLNDRKNISTVIRALPLMDQTISLIIVGELSHLFSGVSNLISELNLSHRVIFTGYVSSENLCWLYKNAFFFCFPSHCEGFGLPPVEAMCLSCPVIASNATAIPEICGDAAIYFDPENTQELSKIVNSADNTLRNKMVKRGLKRVKMYKWKYTAAKITALLHEHFDN